MALGVVFTDDTLSIFVEEPGLVMTRDVLPQKNATNAKETAGIFSACSETTAKPYKGDCILHDPF